MKKENHLPESSQISELVCQFTVVTGSLYSIEQKPESSSDESPAKITFSLLSIYLKVEE